LAALIVVPVYPSHVAIACAQVVPAGNAASESVAPCSPASVAARGSPAPAAAAAPAGVPDTRVGAAASGAAQAPKPRNSARLLTTRLRPGAG
jgi:hypothetical protein